MSITSFDVATLKRAGFDPTVIKKKPRKSPTQRKKSISPTVVDAPIKKLYFKVPEVAHMLNVRRSCVLFWIHAFGLDIKTGRGKTSKITAQDAENITYIHKLLRVDGLQMWKAKERFREIQNKVDATI